MGSLFWPSFAECTLWLGESLPRPSVVGVAVLLPLGSGDLERRCVSPRPLLAFDLDLGLDLLLPSCCFSGVRDGAKSGGRLSPLSDAAPPRGGLFGVGASRGGLVSFFPFPFSLSLSASVELSPDFVFFFGGVSLGPFSSTLLCFCLSACGASPKGRSFPSFQMVFPLWSFPMCFDMQTWFWAVRTLHEWRKAQELPFVHLPSFQNIHSVVGTL